MVTKVCSLFLTLMLSIAGCAKYPSPAEDAKEVGTNKQERQSAATEETTAGPATETFTHVVAVETEYYMGGPMQGRPPEGNFSPGTKVKMTPEQKIGSYVLVESESGIEAYVSSGALKPIGE